MTLTPVLMFLKQRQIKWTLIGISIAFVGLPVIFSLAPYFLGDRVKSGSYLDIVDTKEISRLSVQRLNFSKVVTSSSSKGKKLEEAEDKKLEEADVYIRRIMRGHVTISIDFSQVTIISNSVGKNFVKMPELMPEPFIDEWIFYDSKGTETYGTSDLSKDMDRRFRKAMMEEALKPERVARAKEQAEDIVKMLYDIQGKDKFVFQWPQGSVSDSTNITKKK